MKKSLLSCSLVCAASAALALSDADMREIAERAVREAAASAAEKEADYGRIARDVAEKAARDAAEAAVQAAAEKAAAAAAEKAAAAAAESTAKLYEDKKAEKEELREERRSIETRIFRLEHASAQEVANNFNAMWNGEFGQTWKVTKMAVPFPESNAIMVTAPRPILEACEASIRDLDVEARQVYIEARFVELGNTASHKVGIDWSMLGGMSGRVNLGGGIEGVNVGHGVANYSKTDKSVKGVETSYQVGKTWNDATKSYVGETESDGSVTHFKGTLDFSQMAMTLKALDSTEDAKTFSNPKIIVSSGKKATVDMTTKYPNIKVSAKRTDASGSTSLDIASNMEAIPGEDKFMFAKEAFFSWGISLEVTPRISTNGIINVSIVPTISSRDDWVMTGTDSEDESGTVSTKYPVISVQRLVTEFNLESGTTAVIGGLSVTDEHQVDNGIPVLRDIPWIGPRLFGSMERVKDQKEIIVFVTVGLIDPRNVRRDAGLPKNAVLGRQYTSGQKLEPGDRPQKNMEGIESLDLRLLEEQAKDPLRQWDDGGFDLDRYNPFLKDSDYKKPREGANNQGEVK